MAFGQLLKAQGQLHVSRLGSQKNEELKPIIQHQVHHLHEATHNIIIYVRI